MGTGGMVLVMAPCEESLQEELRRAFGDKHEFVFAESEKQVTDEQVRQAEIIMGGPNEEQLGRAEKLKWVQLNWAGVDKYVRMEHFPAHVQLTNASGAFGTVISEYIVGAVLAQYHKFPRCWDNQRRHLWEGNEQCGGESIVGKQALILGTGDIGANTARRLKAFGIRVAGVNRSGKMPAGESGFDEVHPMGELDRLLPEADLLLCCLPGTGETKGLLNRERLSRMKQDALLVNVGRGNLIPIRDLMEIMSQGGLRGAVLDVVEVEPLPEDSPLWDMERVMITPHASGPSLGSDPYTTGLIWKIFMENLARYDRGEPLENVADLQTGY